MAYTEFYVQPTGSNLNAGSTTADAASLTYASGNWVQSTCVFTVASGDPVADGVVAGDFISVYPDGSSVAVFVTRVASRTSTTITGSTTAKSGTAPTDGTGNRTLKVGGAWAGPNATVGFPLNFANGTMTNASGNVPRVNYDTVGSYVISAGITAASDTGAVWHQGYNSTPGDGGRAIIDGGTSGSAYQLLGATGKNHVFCDLEIKNNGATGSTDAINVTGNENLFLRCVIRDTRGSGLLANAVTSFIECEFYGCNQNNSSSKGGLQALSSGSVIIHCVFHDNTGSNATGGFFDQSMLIYGCIFDSNGNDGASSVGDVNQTYMNCDFYNNGGCGLNMLTTVSMCFNVYNCNFIKNAEYGIQTAGAAKNGRIMNCGFGSGTMANGLGDINEATPGLYIANNITYGTNLSPYVDAPNGDFRISLAAAKNAGIGSFTQTSTSYAGTIAYPDIGAGQHIDSGGGSGGAYTSS